ncbi:MAG: phosphoribosylanthranilate isomerase [bacterium]
MQIKVCGITNLEDALLAVELGVDALGFVFYPPSPRYIGPGEALKIIERLPAEICKVGVFVDERPHKVRSIFHDLNLNLVQLHGHETPQYFLAMADLPLIKAIRGHGQELEYLKEYKRLWALLLDGFDPRVHHCTGRLANWQLAPRIRTGHRLVLAGGLNQGNLAEAVKVVLPDAIDVSSGIEKSPGRKDESKMIRFVKLARQLCSKFSGRPVFNRCG